jgi:hypothetical protein
MQPSARDLTKPQQARSTYTSAPIHRLFMAKAREARERLELELHRDLAKVEHELHRLVHQLTFSLRLRAVLAASLVHVTVYSAANHWPLGTPRLLTLTAFDQAMPFLPLTAFAYVSAYALVFVAFLSLRREASQVRFLEVFIACVLAAGFIHWALPTTYPRALYPLTDDVTAPARALLSLVRAFDTPQQLPAQPARRDFAGVSGAGETRAAAVISGADGVGAGDCGVNLDDEAALSGRRGERRCAGAGQHGAG